MKAIVLAGGYATRLRPISYVLPKLLFPVVGKAMIYWTLDLMKRYAVEEVVLAVNYLADILRATLGSNYEGIRIHYSLENTPLGTGGPIKLASEAARFDETFIAVNGDVIADINLEKMLQHHEKNNALLTDALYRVGDPTRFGVAQLDAKGLISHFVEKPKSRKTSSHLVNAGIYIIEPEVLQMIPSNRKVSLEREIFPVLAKDGKLAGFPFSGTWFDIGSFSDYQKANFALLPKGANRPIGPVKRVRLEKGAIIRPPVIFGDGSMVESMACVGPRVAAGKNELIGKRARVSDSILFDNVTIGEGAVVLGAILASDVVIGRKVKIEAGAIISPHVQIRDGVKIGRKAVVHPHKVVELSAKPETHLM